MKSQAFDLQKSSSCVEHNNRAKYWLNTSHFTGFVDHEKAVDSIYIEPRWKSMMVHEMQQKIIQFIKAKYKDNSLCGKCIVYARNKNRFWVRVFFFFFFFVVFVILIDYRLDLRGNTSRHNKWKSMDFEREARWSRFAGDIALFPTHKMRCKLNETHVTEKHNS